MNALDIIGQDLRTALEVLIQEPNHYAKKRPNDSASCLMQIATRFIEEAGGEEAVKEFLRGGAFGAWISEVRFFEPHAWSSANSDERGPRTTHIRIVFSGPTGPAPVPWWYWTLPVHARPHHKAAHKIGLRWGLIWRVPYEWTIGLVRYRRRLEEAMSQ